MVRIFKKNNNTITESHSRRRRASILSPLSPDLTVDRKQWDASRVVDLNRLSIGIGGGGSITGNKSNGGETWQIGARIELADLTREWLRRRPEKRTARKQIGSDEDGLDEADLDGIGSMLIGKGGDFWIG
ncbi:hypothetical protein L2E82_24402 [Cichorium intybus]|uniref:Uncharacterized protein n=1 Tax=Cichorium intybus TaxID=13427 RepID=A0ACB9E1F8_CICIN|nr:hypothetical protein L2E82_24402 [Cichorium intybus]